MESRKIGRISILILIFVFLIGIAACLPQKEKGNDKPQVQEGAQHHSTLAPGPTGYADIAEATVNSVVNISSTKVVKTQEMSPFSQDPFFRRFFGEPHGGVPRERRQQALGSGVIVSADGYILTNNHVVADASEVKVVLDDQTELDAKVIGTDPKSDLAVIKVERDGLKPITFGDSDALRLGEVVLAIGSPFGLSHTVTMGIVSAKGRSRVGIVDYEDFIQTDAAINPGNSGGALINTNGELVGINTAIASRTGGYEGIGFAIPVNMARRIMDALVQFGRVERGYIGLMIQDVHPDMVEALGLEKPLGALVGEVVADGPAAKAGIERGDVILKFDGKDIDNSSTLRNLASQTEAGKEVEVELMRNGKKKTFNVTIEKLPEEEITTAANVEPDEKDQERIGLRVANLDPMLRQRFSVPKNIEGVIVTRVYPETPAADAGLQVGDVIMEVNRKPTPNVNAMADLVKGAGNKVIILVSREGHTMYSVLKLR